MFFDLFPGTTVAQLRSLSERVSGFEMTTGRVFGVDGFFWNTMNTTGGERFRTVLGSFLLTQKIHDAGLVLVDTDS
jgi:hypothetical protein